MAERCITINRAPVLTLWAAIVAERLGFARDEALSLGKALAGLNAQSKGRRLGIFKPHEEKAAVARRKEPKARFYIELMGRQIPARNTSDGIRAIRGTSVVTPAGVEHYLRSKFGDDLHRANTAMTRLARSRKPKHLAAEAFALYEQFRPAIPSGVRGWGAKGDLDLGLVAALARQL
jgi:hypothetical protein